MSEENVEVVRRWWEGFNEDGMPPLALCDKEIEIRNPPDFPVRGLYQGHDGVRRWRDQVFDIFDNPRVEPEHIVDVHGDGKTVLMLLRATGTASHTGIEVDYEWAAVWTIRAGKVLRGQGYLNRADALEAAGLSE
jgi:ketosteroid isomerase-like protein